MRSRTTCLRRWWWRALRVTTDGTLTRLSTGFGRGRLVAVAVAPCGDVYVGERGGQGRITRFGKDGRAEWTIAVPGAQFYGLTLEGSFLYALDLGHRQIIRLPIGPCAPTLGQGLQRPGGGRVLAR